MTSYVNYHRVSTVGQGRSGLGLEAQQEAVQRHLGPDADIVVEYTETESGRKDDRPELAKALDHCRRTGAVLVVAKLDRLARSAHFLLTILKSGVEVQFADLPQVSGPQGKFLLTSMAAVAELEAGLISERTRAALQAAKKRGVKLGGPLGSKPLVDYVKANGNGAAIAGKTKAANARAESYRGVIESMVADGLNNSEIARELDNRGERTVRGGRWTGTAVKRILVRLCLDDATRCSEAA